MNGDTGPQLSLFRWLFFTLHFEGCNRLTNNTWLKMPIADKDILIHLCVGQVEKIEKREENSFGEDSSTRIRW
jgi:hypothetical protein